MEDNLGFVLGMRRGELNPSLWRRFKEKDGIVHLIAIELQKIGFSQSFLKELDLGGNIYGDLYNLTVRQVPCAPEELSDKYPVINIPYYQNDIARKIGYYPNTVYLHSVAACMHKEKIYYAGNYEIPRTHIDDHYSEIFCVDSKGTENKIYKTDKITFLLFVYAGQLCGFEGERLNKILRVS